MLGVSPTGTSLDRPLSDVALAPCQLPLAHRPSSLAQRPSANAPGPSPLAPRPSLSTLHLSPNVSRLSALGSRLSALGRTCAGSSRPVREPGPPPTFRPPSAKPRFPSPEHARDPPRDCCRTPGPQRRLLTRQGLIGGPAGAGPRSTHGLLDSLRRAAAPRAHLKREGCKRLKRATPRRPQRAAQAT